MTSQTLLHREPATTRALHLRQATRSAHERLDADVTALDPFASQPNYARLLEVHYRFHRDIAPLYDLPALAAIVPDLAERRRIEAIERDYADLALPLPASPWPPLFEARETDVATALGWLYVAEGSTLGAALLLKAVGGIGLNAGFGARHLAGHADGRAQHWRSFTAALDAAQLGETDEPRVAAGAKAAFAHVQRFVDAA